jgi:hypothetical protein
MRASLTCGCGTTQAEGLLETDYVRLTGRTGRAPDGPRSGIDAAGASSPSPFRRGSMNWPDRSWPKPSPTPPQPEPPSRSLSSRAAAAQGRAIASAAADPPIQHSNAEIDRIAALLRQHGYEPRRNGDSLVLANCPFHALARRHTQLVCQINHAIITELARSIAPGQLDAQLQPSPTRCCVTLSSRIEPA